MIDINVCLTCDNNYAQHAGVVIASILKNSNADERHHIYIIENNISAENKEKIYDLKNIKNFDISFIPYNKDYFKNFEDIKTTSYLPIASFFRLAIPSSIQNIDKIIYLDPDIIVNTSLSELYNTDITDYYCGGILDIGHKRLAKKIELKKNEFYVNSGVLLINLKKWRDDNVEEMFIEYAKNNSSKIHLGDQDIINKCFAGKILQLESKWNVQVVNYSSCSDYSGYFNILHYTGHSKPWKFGSYIPAKEHYFTYLTLTKWDKPDNNWHKKSNLTGIWLYFKHRPLFLFRLRFYKYLFGFVINKTNV